MPSIESSSSKPKSNGWRSVSDRPLRARGHATHRRAHGLVGGVVPDLEVRVLERLLAGDALRGVEVEELAEQIDREGICAREERLEGHTRLNWQRTDVILGLHDKVIRSVRQRVGEA